MSTIKKFMREKGMRTVAKVNGGWEFDGKLVDEGAPFLAEIDEMMQTHRHDETYLFRIDGVSAIAVLHTGDVPSLGGIRGLTRRSCVEDSTAEMERIRDAMRFTNALQTKVEPLAQRYGFTFSAGKLIVAPSPREQGRRDRAVAAMLAELNADRLRFVGADDIGTSLESLVSLYGHGATLVGMPPTEDGASAVSATTAYGMNLGLDMIVEQRFGAYDGRVFAFQGLGKAALPIAQHVLARGGSVVYARRSEANSLEGATRVSVDTIYDVACDVFVPAAEGGTVNPDTVPRLRATVVYGPANLQTGTGERAQEAEAMLAQRGVLYVPSHLVNIGGAMEALRGYCELTGQRVPYADARVETARIVTENIRKVFTM